MRAVGDDRGDFGARGRKRRCSAGHRERRFLAADQTAARDREFGMRFAQREEMVVITEDVGARGQIGGRGADLKLEAFAVLLRFVARLEAQRLPRGGRRRTVPVARVVRDVVERHAGRSALLVILRMDEVNLRQDVVQFGDVDGAFIEKHDGLRGRGGEGRDVEVATAFDETQGRGAESGHCARGEILGERGKVFVDAFGDPAQASGILRRGEKPRQDRRKLKRARISRAIAEERVGKVQEHLETKLRGSGAAEEVARE